MITAMNGIEILALVLLIVAVAGLVSYVRHDGFAAHRNAARDELGQPRSPQLI
jgi:hypothetical protein